MHSTSIDPQDLAQALLAKWKDIGRPPTGDCHLSSSPAPDVPLAISPWVTTSGHLIWNDWATGVRVFPYWRRIEEYCVCAEYDGGSRFAFLARDADQSNPEIYVRENMGWIPTHLSLGSLVLLLLGRQIVASSQGTVSKAAAGQLDDIRSHAVAAIGLTLRRYPVEIVLGADTVWQVFDGAPPLLCAASLPESHPASISEDEGLASLQSWSSDRYLATFSQIEIVASVVSVLRGCRHEDRFKVVARLAEERRRKLRTVLEQFVDSHDGASSVSLRLTSPDASASEVMSDLTLQDADDCRRLLGWSIAGVRLESGEGGMPEA